MTSNVMPSDMVAVLDQSDSRYWVYYVNTDGSINVFKGPQVQTVENAEDNPEYDGPFTVTYAQGKGAPKANTCSPRLAVVDYTPKGGVQEVCFVFSSNMNFCKTIIF
jgi:hypothetical protein